MLAAPDGVRKCTTGPVLFKFCAVFPPQGGQRGQKAWEALMAELAAVYPSVVLGPRHATRAVCGAWPTRA